MLKTPFPSRLHRLSVLKAAFGMALPGDEESEQDEYADATHFQARGRAYAEGGELPDAPLGKKREADTGVDVDDPDYQLPVYRGESAKQRTAEPAPKPRPKDLPALAEAERHADGGEVDADESMTARFHRWLSSDDAAGSGKEVAEKAVDSTDGMVKKAADAARAHNARLEEAERLASGNAHGGEIHSLGSAVARARAAAHHAVGGEIENRRPTFSDALVRRMKFGRSCR